MSEVNWDIEIWNIIDSYFKNTNNYLSKHQIDSYNTFLNKNISKTIRQFNPIILPYAKTVDTGDSENLDYMFELRITVGGSYNKDSNEVLNDGSSIFVGKPIIQEVKRDEENQINVYQKTLYPNEARLKNITYKTEINVDIIVEMLVFSESTGKLEPALKEPKQFKNVTLTRNLPIMLQSQICSLGSMQGSALRLMGECEYDQGGYFIIDGKEKVIVAQERQIENKVYINENKPDERYKFNSEIRSAPENKFQPARITKCFVLNGKNTPAETIEEDVIRVSIPNINGEIPLFIVFRALGIITDLDICNTIVDNIESPIGKKILEFLEPTIKEGYLINNQVNALRYLESKISSSFMTSSIDKNTRLNYLLHILRDYFLPHCGGNNYEKSYYLGYMIVELIYTRLNLRKKTDRDSYIYKRVDTSGFLLSAIFRDLYFRVKNKMIENVNIAYSSKDDDNNSGLYWQSYVTSTDEYKDYNFLKLLAFDDEADGVKKISEVFDETIMNEGFMYAFKNCWGLKNAPCKQGIVQDMNRLSFAGAVSHIRRVNTPLSSSAKVRAPHMLHLSSYGYMCPYETPDGGNIGLRKNISLFCNITSGTNSTNLIKLLYTSGLEDILQIEKNKLTYTRVFLNEKLIGYTKKPLYMTNKLKLLKRNALINVYTSIAWYIDTSMIKISTDSGRPVRPVLIVKDGKTKLTNEILSDIKNNKINWYHLVGGFRNTDKRMPYNDNDGSYYIDPIENSLEEMERLSGIIEYIDAEESNVSLISMNLKSLSNKIDKYNYCEIHPSLSLGVLASMIPGVEMNQQPRNLFSTGQSKQALGMYATNYRNRMDTKGQIMNYPQLAIVKNKLSKYLNYDELPHGINAIVALGCFSGYNQEDSIIFNKSSVQRGLFRTAKFKTFSDREEIKNGIITEYICNPDPNTVQGIKSGNYSKLDENGIIKEESYVNYNDILIGKCVKTGQKDSDGNEIILDKSEAVKKTEEGFIDKVYSNTGNDKQRYVKVRIRKEKIPEIGDKFTSRYGQKGTIGMLLDEENMPRTAEGIIPDMIVNTHAFPSRMTIAQFFEVLLGKLCVSKGLLSEIVPFSDIDVEGVAKLLQNSCGFEKYGNEILYSGIDGRQLNVEFFVGPTYYQRLTQQVSDKYQSRDDGSKTALTHQPVSGRALGGGGRLGEMERDAMLSHGITSFIKESFMERSDKFQFFISNKTGMISVYNPVRKIYRDFASDETIQYKDHNNNVVKRQFENTVSDFSAIESPYSFKLLLQEIETMGIATRLISKSIVEEWEKIDGTDVPTKFEKVENEMRKKLNEGYYKDIDSKLTVPLRSFHNKIKLHLINGASVKNASILDLSCGRGGDLLKWYMSGYSRVLGFDLDKDNIESGALKRLSEMKTGDNTRSREWANISDINFLVGDASKLLFDGDISRNTQYEQKANEIMKNVSKNSFNTVSMQFAVHYLFDEYQRVDNFFKNARDSLLSGGYLLITTLDGPSVYEGLKKSKTNTLSGYVYDEEKGDDVLVWKISAGSSLDLSGKTLSSNLETGFGNKINVMFESIGAEYEESLVHPSILISMAAKYNLEILDSYEVKSKFKLFRNGTGLFKDIYRNFYNHFESNEDIRNLSTRNNEDLKAYSNMHRYYIFKHNTDNKTGYSYSDYRLCSQANKQFYEQRYKLKLPTKTALDVTLLNRYINEPRALIGNAINKTSDNYQTNNSFVQDSNKKVIENTNLRLLNKFYNKLNSASYINTMEYVFKYIKVGIYVRIVNNTVVQFMPMLNYGSKSNNLFVDSIDNLEYGSVNRDLFNNVNPNDIVEYLNHKYGSSSIYKEWYSENINKKQYTNILNEKNNRGNSDIIIDGSQVYIGYDIIEKFIPQYSVYRDMINSLCNNKSNQISNSEFVINLLNHPISKIDSKNNLLNPYDYILKENAANIHISGNILPVIGPTMKDGYLDISIPSVLQWSLCTDTILPPMCNALDTNIELFKNSIINKNKKPRLAVVTNLDGDYKNNLRLEYLENIENIANNLQKHNVDLVTRLDINRIPNYHGEGKIAFYDSYQELKSVTSRDMDFDSFPYDSKMILYIGGNGSDDIFTKTIATRCLLIKYEKDDSSKYWYQNILEPLDLDTDFSRLDKNFSTITADYIQISNLESSLEGVIKLLVKYPSLVDRLQENKHAKTTKYIFNIDYVQDYMQYVINEIGKKTTSEYVNEDIFRNPITEEGTRTSIKFKKEYLGILIGKDGKNIQNIMNITNTNIEIPRSDKEYIENGISYTTVTIQGGVSSVSLAETIVNKINDSVGMYKQIPRNRMSRFFESRAEGLKKIQTQLSVKIYTKVSDNEMLEWLSTNDMNYVQFTEKSELIKVVGSNDSLDKADIAIDNLVNEDFYTMNNYLQSLEEEGEDDTFRFGDGLDDLKDFSSPQYGFDSGYGVGYGSGPTSSAPMYSYAPKSPEYLPKSPEYLPKSPDATPSPIQSSDIHPGWEVLIDQETGNTIYRSYVIGPNGSTQYMDNSSDREHLLKTKSMTLEGVVSMAPEDWISSDVSRLNISDHTMALLLRENSFENNWQFTLNQIERDNRARELFNNPTLMDNAGNEILPNTVYGASDLLIVVPYIGNGPVKGEDVSESRIEINEFDKKFIDFVTALDDVLNEAKQGLLTQRKHSILIVGYNNTILTPAEADKLYILDDITYKKTDDSVILNCNKGGLFNLAAISAYLQKPEVNNIIFNEPFLLPNLELAKNYFMDIAKNTILNLSLCYDKFEINNRLGIYGINKETFVENASYPNHIWSYHGIDQYYRDMVSETNSRMSIINHLSSGIEIKDQYPDFHKFGVDSLDSVSYEDLQTCRLSDNTVNSGGCSNARQLILSMPTIGLTYKPYTDRNIEQVMYDFGKNMLPVSLLAFNKLSPLITDSDDTIEKLGGKLIQNIGNYIDNINESPGEFIDNTYRFQSKDESFLQKLEFSLDKFMEVLKLNKNSSVNLTSLQLEIMLKGSLQFNTVMVDEVTPLITMSFEYQSQTGGNNNVSIELDHGIPLNTEVVVLNGKHKHKIGSLLKINKKSVTIKVANENINMKTDVNNIFQILKPVSDLFLEEEDYVYGTVNDEFGRVVGYIRDSESNNVIFNNSENLTIHRYTDFVETSSENMDSLD